MAGLLCRKLAWLASPPLGLVCLSAWLVLVNSNNKPPGFGRREVKCPVIDLTKDWLGWLG